MKKNYIITGDCIQEMKKFSDRSIDVIITDPPYNAKNIGPNKRTYSMGPMQLPEQEYKKFCNDWINEALRIANTIVMTPGIANMCYYPQPSWVVCWSKPQAVSFNRMGGFNVWEPIFIYGKVAKGKRLERDLILQGTFNLSKGPERFHPCPKPLPLMKVLIEKFSNEGDLILDPFMGSGTTVLAAKYKERNYIGIEINPEYVEIAESRLSQDLLPMSVTL